METFFVLVCISLFVTLIFFYRRVEKLYYGNRAIYGKHDDSSFEGSDYAKLVFLSVLVIALVAATSAFVTARFYHQDLYKVIDAYNTGAGVRCLTDDEHDTTAIPLPKEEASKIKEFDLIDKYGNVIVDGVWLGAEPTVADETVSPVG